MTNPNDAIGTNAAYGARTSVNAFNDIAQILSGRGLVSGFVVAPKSGMTVSVGGQAGTRDVAVAEDNLGNRSMVNNRLGSEVDITLAAASVSSNRYSAIVAYINNPAQSDDTTPDAPSVCGIIEVQGNSTGVSEAQIRSAITADGGTGSVAYYVVIATIYVGSGTTTITSANISQSWIGAEIAQATYDAIGSYSTSEVATPFKWIDGKTIYKKTIEETISSVPSSGLTWNHGIANIGTITKYEVLFNLGWSTDSWGDNAYLARAGLVGRVTTTQLLLETSSASSWRGTIYYTLYYTKTS